MGIFFAAAAEAMRRILVESTRRKRSVKHGGAVQRRQFGQIEASAVDRADELLTVHDALDELAARDVQAAELVKLRYFAGLGHQEAADTLGISRRAADRLWAVARVWLYSQMHEE